MAYYLVQRRHLKAMPPAAPILPGQVRATILLGPEDAFGVEGTSPRTTLQLNSNASIMWDANEGLSHIDGGLIEALAGTFAIDPIEVHIAGNECVITAPAESLDEASALAQSATQILPTLLSFRLRVNVWIRQMRIEYGSAQFNSELDAHASSFFVATAQTNLGNIERAFAEWLALRPCHLRIIAAMLYLRHANRLASLQPDPESMVAEVLLNLTKALESVFSSDRQQLRLRASQCGFSEEFVEQRLIPLFLVRNSLDIAHAAITPLSTAHRDALVNFMYRALSHVHEALEEVAAQAYSGAFTLEPPSPALDDEKERLLAAISAYAESP